MPKTKKALLHAVADKIGGEQGARLRDTLRKKTPFDDVLDRPMSDETFEAELKKAGTDFPKALAHLGLRPPEEPGSWGFQN